MTLLKRPKFSVDGLGEMTCIHDSTGRYIGARQKFGSLGAASQMSPRPSPSTSD